MNEEKVPVGTLVVREHGGQPYYEAKWRHRGKQVKLSDAPRDLRPAKEPRDRDRAAAAPAPKAIEIFTPQDVRTLVVAAAYELSR